MTVNIIKQLFEKFSNKKILVIGDVMLDSYTWGKVNRISPEAPVPVLSVSKRDYLLGGAANVAKNIKSLGASPLLATCIGKDDAGQKILNLLTMKGFETKAIIRSNKRKTTLKMRFLSQGQHLVRVDEENPVSLTKDLEENLFEKIQYFFNSYKIDAIIFADYDKGMITKRIIENIIAISKDKGISVFVDPKHRNFKNYRDAYLFKPNIKEFVEIENIIAISKDKGISVFVDPKHRNFKNYRDAYLFKPNIKEFVEGLGINSIENDYEKLFDICQKFQHRYSIDNVIITLSEKGVFISNKENYFSLPAVVRSISDVSGAGDTVISVTTLCMLCGLSLYNSAKIANLAGGIVCEYPMVVPIDKNRLFSECKKNIKSFSF